MALTDNILAYWKFDTSSWLDSTPNGHNLTQHGTNVSIGTGIIAGDANFSGDAGTWLKSDSSFNPLNGSQFSVSGWLKTTGGGTIVSGNSNGYAGFDISFSNGQTDQPRFLVGTGGNYEIAQGDINIGDNSWHHFVGTYNQNGNITFYIDGSINAQIAASGNSPNGCINGVGINNDPDGNGYGAGGAAEIDEVGIWNRELSSVEVTSLYNSGAGWTYPLTALYYNNAQSDGDWGNILNWWQDSGFSIQATALPTATTPVNLYNQVTQNTQGADQCFCSSANFWSANFGAGLTLQPTGVVNMQGTSLLAGTTTDGVSMHDSSQLASTSVVDGDVTMRDSSRAFGHIGGNATVYYDSGNGQYPIGGTVTGTVSYLEWPAKTPQWFNDQVTGSGAASNWEDLDNWWADDAFTTRPINSVGTQSLPDAGTNIYVYGSGLNAYNSNSNISVNSARFYSNSILGNNITLVVSVDANFFDFSGAQSQVFGNCYFRNSSYLSSNYAAGYVHGNVYLYDNSGVYMDYSQDNSLASGGLYIYSIQSLKNSFSYHFGSSFGGIVYNLPSGGGGGFISRLLNLPWFIKI